MRKFMLLFVLVSLLLLPTGVQAQGGVNFSDLTIQLWPEYDHPDMLVMYSFTLAADSVLPAEVQVRIPANANLNAVAKVEDGSMVNVPYDAPIKEGDWVVITIVVDDFSGYRVEYYAPITKSGTTRTYDYLWENDYAADSLYVQFQQPPTASDFSSTPLLINSNVANDGIVYYELNVGELAAESEFALKLSYEKANDDLTVSSMPVEVGGGNASDLSTPESSFSLEAALPFILVGVGILLIAGGLLYFFSAGKQDTVSEQGRKRHSPSTASGGGNVYCHECGSRASASDKFCRSCGAKIRT